MFSPASVRLFVSVSVPRYLKNKSFCHRIAMKLIGYYYWVDGTNWLNFGEAVIKCLWLIAKTQKGHIFKTDWDIDLKFGNPRLQVPNTKNKQEVFSKIERNLSCYLLVCKICKNQMIRLISNFHVFIIIDYYIKCHEQIRFFQG